MPNIGRDTPGGSLTAMAENYIYALWIHPGTITNPAIVTKAWFYGRKNTAGSTTVKVSIYKKGATVALTTLVATASITVQQGEDPWPGQWWSADFGQALEMGETYIVTVMGAGTTGTVMWNLSASAGNKSLDVGDYDPPANLTGASDWGSDGGLYFEYEEFEYHDLSDDTAGSFPILAPVEPNPILTSGQSPTSMAGHEPKFAIDNNLNTYWEPSSYADNSIWFDLGEATTVYAIVIWLHNYNEPWGSPTSWQISYSSDDSSYGSFDEKLFVDYGNFAAPIVVDVLPGAISARYWKITFKNFDDYPKVHKVQISNFWFVLPYYMTHRRSLPATDIHSYQFDTLKDAVNRQLTNSYYRHRRLLLPIDLTLTSENDFDRLNSMHEASLYGARPIFCKPRHDDSWWRIMNISGLTINRDQGEIWRTSFRLEDVGHDMIERYHHIYRQHPETVGNWNFQDTLDDSSAQDNHLTGSGVSASNYVYGIGRDHKTALTVYDGSSHYGYIPFGSAGDFDMGTSDFTIEMIMLITQVADPTDFVRKLEGTPYTGWKLKCYVDGSDLILRMDLGDGTNQLINRTATGKNIGDNEWHYIAVVVNRTTDLLKFYIDEVQYGGDIDISSITGNISAPTANLLVWAPGNANTAYDVVEITKRSFTLAEIQERAVGSISWGTWRI